MIGYSNPRALIEARELLGRLGDPSLRIVDCTVRLSPRPGGGYDIVKGDADWARGHIPGADFIDLGEELAGPPGISPYAMPDAGSFARVIGAHGIGNDNDVVVYSAGGIANAARLFLMFRAMGHDRVRLLNGGWEAWLRGGYPTSTAHPGHAPTAFRPSPRDGHFLDKPAMKAELGRTDTHIVMALPSDVFHGDRVIFDRPGRIPGSMSIPAGELLDPTGTAFLPIEALERRLSAVISAERVVNYCGAGMTAAVNAFALHLIGYESGAIYDGSMLEWAADETLPLEPAA